jgi:hypothetical protein
MGEWGFFGYFKDSESNLMGLFQTPERQERPDAPDFLTSKPARTFATL